MRSLLGCEIKTIGLLVWACDAKGRDPHNKKHITYDSDGNKTQRTSKDNVGNVKNVDTTMVETGNVTVSNK